MEKTNFSLLSVSGEHSHHPEVRELHSGNPLMKRVGAGNMASVPLTPPPTLPPPRISTDHWPLSFLTRCLPAPQLWLKGTWLGMLLELSLAPTPALRHKVRLKGRGELFRLLKVPARLIHPVTPGGRQQRPGHKRRSL